MLSLRDLPAVNVVLDDPRVAALPRGVAVAVVREVLDGLRARIKAGELASLPDVGAAVVAAARPLVRGRIRPVINATGVVVHTNLGRAPWSPQAVAAATAVAGGYCDLELDLETGERGKRTEGAEALLRHLVGAEASCVVNNCAAAVLLALTALAKDREVVVSRGELVEIGGSFRVPDVITACGARLVDVGTTNRTRIADFERAVGPDTAVLLRVHPSNFRVVGFTEAPTRDEVVALARSRGLAAIEDVGSGSLDGLFGEPSVREAVASGLDVVLFSGDKLLGGPQAGIAVGRRDAIAKMRKHPLYRALRVDKITLVALEATLAAHAAGVAPPVPAMIALSPEVLAARADDLCGRLVAGGVLAVRARGEAFVGGGSLPGQALMSEAVDVTVGSAERAARALRLGEPAVVARIVDGRVRLDPRTVRPDEVDALVAAVVAACRA